MIMSALSSCGSMFTGTVTTTMASTYLSLPAEIDAADLSFTEKEMELQNKIDRIETDYPGYDEYDYNLGAIGHDPYTLISYLSAVHTEFTAAGIESEIQELFDAMYSLTTEEVEETRTRTVTKTGTRIVTNPDGTTRTEEYEYEEEEEYTVTILRVTLTVTPLESIVAGRMDSEQTEIFGAYTETKGGLQVFASPVDYYWSLNVSAGQSVKKGDNIGKSGNTGSSTGSHLHIECLYNGEYYNPLFYFEAGEQTIYGETTGGTGGGTSNVIPLESYDDATVTLQRCRRLCVKQTGIWECHILLAAQLRLVLTVPVLYAGYFQTVAYITCQEPQHRAFMTSVLRYQRQMQRQGTLYFLQEPIMQDVRLHTLVSTVETVRWCIAVIQFSTHQSILLTGRAISMVLED